MDTGSVPSTTETLALFDKYVIPNYRRYPVNLVRGEGSLIWDGEGREYLDFFPGWGCNLLGHCPPRIVQAVQQQVATLIHVPNSWHIHLQGIWAEMLVERSFDGQAFFCNSGAEANEAAIKLVRLHQGPERYKIITFQGGFHGRTLGALAATAQPKYHAGLGPMVPGFVYAPPFDLAEVEKRIDGTTAAIMIEPIQGEGGVRIPSGAYLQGLRDLADTHGLLLVFDEVQTGCGRTGKWFGHQYFGVTPDIMTLAKSLCGGIAGGAMIARREIAGSLKPGMHASTFGGNPIAAAAGIAMIETIEAEGLLSRAQSNSDLFGDLLADLAANCPHIREVRRAGMMIGIELDFDGTGVVQACLEKGLLINCTQSTVIRLLPAMNIEESQIRRGMAILAEAIHEVVQSLVPQEQLAPFSKLGAARDIRRDDQNSRCVVRHFITLFDISQQELQTILSLAEQIKQMLQRGHRPPWLARRVLAMLFEKPSLRTRVSFEAGMIQLGGAAMFLGKDVGWQSRESTGDFVRVLAQYADYVVCRAKCHASVVELAKYNCVPVINGLTDVSHPCQALADLLTMQAIAGPLAGKTLTFVGDGNNVARSLAVGCAMVGMRFRLLGPGGYTMSDDSIDLIHSRYPNADILQSTDAASMLRDADFVYTDVWTSMGQEAEAAERRSIFAPFQLNVKLLANARNRVRILHCLPAKRGEEITDEVMDSPDSAVVEQAGNRMHAQKALLVWLAVQHNWLESAQLEQDGIELPMGIS